MLIFLANSYTESDLDNLITWLLDHNFSAKIMEGFILVEGDTYLIDESILRSFKIVDKVQRLDKPYHLASRDYHPEDTVVEVKNARFGEGFTLIAGPCTIESEDILYSIASSIKASGAQALRGGAFKPRTSPYSFQGFGEDALAILADIGSALDLPTVSEIMEPSQLPLFKDIDILQVGSKNMQNFELLKALGKSDKPVLLKRGLSSTIDEFLMSAEYLLSFGNDNVILCERGIRTFEHATRNTLDLASVPLLKELTHLPIIVDPSHATGNKDLVTPMSLAACVCGSDGLMLEVHNNPISALCDGPQAISPEAFKDLSSQLSNLLPFRYNKNY